ncbi:hypothetical protein ACEQ6C_39285, partial [Rhizobium ruizarguesonis]
SKFGPAVVYCVEGAADAETGIARDTANKDVDKRLKTAFLKSLSITIPPIYALYYTYSLFWENLVVNRTNVMCYLNIIRG